MGIGLDVSNNETMKACSQWFKDCESIDFGSKDYDDVYRKESYDEDEESEND